MKASVVGHKCPYKWVNQLIIHLNQLISLKYIYTFSNKSSYCLRGKAIESFTILNQNWFIQERSNCLKSMDHSLNQIWFVLKHRFIKNWNYILFAGVIWSVTQPNRWWFFPDWIRLLSLWVSKSMNHSLNWISLFKNIKLFSIQTIEFCSKTHNI